MKKMFNPQQTHKPKHGKLETALQQALLAMIQQEPKDWSALQTLARLAQQAQSAKR